MGDSKCAPPVIFLMGATATGKTALSLKLAQTLDAEIISVDSALVYRMMDIGTAKPSMQERCGVVHHLIDVCDPWDTYSAARFCADARVLVNQIQARGKRVLLVGGTMLYFKALEEGLAPLPEADESIRAAIVAQAAQSGWQAIHEELRLVDSKAAQRIHPNDPQRLQRALEVYRITGKPLSQWLTETHSSLAQPAVKFALIPADRKWLHHRIESRFRQMIKDGFFQEVKKLYANPRLQAELPSMRSIGYRQVWEHLAMQEQPASEQTPLSDWVEASIVATRQLAKRQLTWMRGMSDVHSIECDTLSLCQQAIRIGRNIDRLEE